MFRKIEYAGTNLFLLILTTHRCANAKYLLKQMENYNPHPISEQLRDFCEFKKYLHEPVFQEVIENNGFMSIWKHVNSVCDNSPYEDIPRPLWYYLIVLKFKFLLAKSEHDRFLYCTLGSFCDWSNDCSYKMLALLKALNSLPFPADWLEKLIQKFYEKFKNSLSSKEFDVHSFRILEGLKSFKILNLDVLEVEKGLLTILKENERDLLRKTKIKEALNILNKYAEITKRSKLMDSLICITYDYNKLELDIKDGMIEYIKGHQLKKDIVRLITVHIKNL